MLNHLFRGKRVHTQKWEYGFYVSTPSLPFSDSKHYILEFVGIESGEPEFIWHEVIPETVGMSLNCKDKNGKDIFCGDILKAKFGTGIGGKSTRYKEMYFSVDYYQNDGVVHLINMPNNYGNYRFCPHLSQSEISGTIHDNPELLKSL